MVRPSAPSSESELCDRGQGSAPAIRGDQQVLQTLPGHPGREAQEEECGEGKEEGQEHQDWSSLSRHHSFSHQLHVIGGVSKITGWMFCVEIFLSE